MEITGYETLSTDELSVSTNPYLEDIEIWDERELPLYRKKITDRIISGYTSAVLGGLIAYGLYIVFFAIVASMFTDLYAMLCSSYVAQWICMGVFYVVVFFLVHLYGQRTMATLETSCHGEIGHDGKPFIRSIIVHIVISALLCVVCTAAAVLYFYREVGSAPGLLVLESFVYLPAVIAPFAYFVGTLTARRSMVKCPVCGRYDTVYRVKSSRDFGQRKDGHHQEFDYEQERVGTRTTTTYYSDGTRSTDTEGIYESVRYTNEYDDYSSLAKYTYLCRECSYAEETLEEKKWKSLRTRYRG